MAAGDTLINLGHKIKLQRGRVNLAAIDEAASENFTASYSAEKLILGVLIRQAKRIINN